MKNFLWKSIKRLANLNLSLSILSLIAIFCIIGSVIEQDQLLSYYSLNYSKYSNVIIVLGIDHVFRTWWFILILVTFILSLLSCTFFTQLPTLKNARRWKFMYSKKNLDSSNYIVTNYSALNYSFTNVIYSLVRLNFFVFSRSSSIYSYKGLYGRIAPIFVHFSIVMILLGSVYSFLFSFVVQELVPCSELFHIKNIVHAGFYSRLPSNILFHVNDFYIDYNLNGSIKQFFSLISLYFENKRFVNPKLIFVNKPLRLSQISMYQTDWHVDALRLKFGNSYSVQKRLIKSNLDLNTCWLTNILIDSKKRVLFIIFNLDKKVSVYDENGGSLGEFFLGQKFYVNQIPITVEDIITSTGMQIKADPGITFVYLGFLIMMCSTFISYVSYSQIWINIAFNNINFFGCTNRGILLFEQELMSLQKICFSYIYLTDYDLGKINSILR